MEIFDTHTHINSDEFKTEIPEVIERARAFDVTKMAIVGFDQPSILKSLALAKDYPNLYSIIGWHPEEAKTYTPETEKVLIEQLQTPKVVAMGEMGLDYHWDTSPVETQKKVFKRQIEIAKSLNLPISIHNRDAFEDVYTILKEADIRDIGGIMHSFNGDAKWADKFLDLGMHLSYSGIVTYNSAKEVHEAVKVTPIDRILIETDAPYLTPEPYRGQRNEPGYTRYVLEAIAKIRESSSIDMASATFKNAEKLFRIG